VTPPDVIICTSEPAADYYLMQNKFLDLCAKSEDCDGDRELWQRRFDSWAPATDSGWCTYTMRDVEFEVDMTKKFGDLNWVNLNAASLVIPSQSWAEMKSYILKICKKNNDCAADLGKWTRKMDLLEQKMSVAPTFAE
jgi:hypothetical protein